MKLSLVSRTASVALLTATFSLSGGGIMPLKAATEYLAQPVESPELTKWFQDQLAPFGQWFETRKYGRVWQPEVALRDPNWRPYTLGSWAYTEQGWTWISTEPFGASVYHYGRWALLGDVGWAWIPGDEWAPAWVSWRQSESHIGWAPLPPETMQQGNYTLLASTDEKFSIDASLYTFVPIETFGAPIATSTTLSMERNPVIYNDSVCITRISSDNGYVYLDGPSYQVVNRRLATPIPWYSVRRGPVGGVAVGVQIGTPANGFITFTTGPGSRANNGNNRPQNNNQNPQRNNPNANRQQQENNASQQQQAAQRAQQQQQNAERAQQEQARQQQQQDQQARQQQQAERAARQQAQVAEGENQNPRAQQQQGGGRQQAPDNAQQQQQNAERAQQEQARQAQKQQQQQQRQAQREAAQQPAAPAAPARQPQQQPDNAAAQQQAAERAQQQQARQAQKQQQQQERQAQQQQAQPEASPATEAPEDAGNRRRGR